MNLSPLPVQRFYSNIGLPLVGGKLFTYIAGTTAKIATYTDSTGGASNTNPVILNFRGEANIWLDQALTYKFVLASPFDTDPPTNPIWTVDNISAGVTFASLTQQILGLIIYPRTPAEFAALITPTFYIYPELDARRYGFSTGASAATNSTALQSASEVAYQGGGGTVLMPPGRFNIDAPIRVWETVSMRGAGKFSTTLKKTTATASLISDNTVRRWDSAVVGFPVCAIHCVAKDTVSSWSYATLSDFGVEGDTTSPNTTTTVYGFFFRGLNGAQQARCFAQYVQVGHFYGAGNTILAEINNSNALNVQRGFYQAFMTSSVFHDNYANNYRFAGYYLSAYYSSMVANAADNGGGTWKVGTTEICLAYEINGCRGGEFSDNGCETHNGSVWLWTNNLSTLFRNNLALQVTSNYTGGGDIVLEEHNSNNSCIYQDNRAQTSGMTGTGARHFIYKIASELGNYIWQRDRFVANVTDTTNTSTWANTSGTIIETTSVVEASGTFTPTVAGTTTAGVTTYTTQTGTYERLGNTVKFRLRVGWSNQTGTGNLVVGGLPFTSANTDIDPCSIVADSLTFAGQLAAAMRQNSTLIDLYSVATGAALAGIAIDTAASLFIAGSYLVP